MATAPVTVSVQPNDKGQPSKRRWQSWEDQHARMWGSEIETKTGDPCGMVTPDGWAFPDDRLVPEQKYLRIPRDRHNRPLAGKVVIAYDEWMRDLAASHAEWERLLRHYATAISGERAAAEIAHPSPALLSLVGPKPLAVEVVYACQAGDRWALGQGGRRPEWADKYLPPVTRVAVGAVEIDPAFKAQFEPKAEGKGGGK